MPIRYLGINYAMRHDFSSKRLMRRDNNQQKAHEVRLTAVHDHPVVLLYADGASQQPCFLR